MRNHLVHGAGAILAIILATSSAQAQMTVIDPTNLAQNVLQAARALEQINKQIEQIEQQAKMLAQSPLQLSPDLAASMEEARAVLAAAEGVAFALDRVEQDIRTLYPETWADFGLDEMRGRSRDWLRESRASLERAMRAEAQAASALEASRGHVEQALAASAGAQGQTSAAQAGNQLLGVTATQLAEIQALLAAQGRALQTERLERVAREERATEILRRAFPVQSGATTPSRTAFR